MQNIANISFCSVFGNKTSSLKLYFVNFSKILPDPQLHDLFDKWLYCIVDKRQQLDVIA